MNLQAASLEIEFTHWVYACDNLFQELQEEKATLTSELLTLKTRPTAVDKRGNSLFAEVDDKRQSVAQKLDAMHKKYKELKKNFIKKNAELRALEVICYFICSVCDKVNVV